MSGAGECRNEIELYARDDGATKKAVEEIHSFPALHDPLHQFGRQRIGPDGPIRYPIRAEQRVSLDDVAMNRIGFPTSQADIGVVPEHSCDCQPVLE